MSQRGDTHVADIQELALRYHSRSEYLDIPGLPIDQFAHVQECLVTSSQVKASAKRGVFLYRIYINGRGRIDELNCRQAMFFLHTTGELQRPFLRTPEDDMKETNPDKAFVKIVDNSFATGTPPPLIHLSF